MTTHDLHIKQILIPLDDTEVQEGLILFPSVATLEKLPLIVFIHGHNTWGGWELLAPAQRLLKQGYAVLLPSQIGFGMSAGKKDYCGPKTVASIEKLITATLDTYSAQIDFKKVAVWGASRGAVVASNLTVTYPNMFAAGVFLSGTYDMVLNVAWSKKDPEIVQNIINETGGTPASYKDRSSIHKMSALQCPVLILHGENDETVSVEQAVLLDKQLTTLQKSHQLVIVKDGKHHIGNPKISREYIFPFLKSTLQ